MNFIKVHSDNSTCLINLDNVEMFRGEDKDDKVGVYFADGTVGLGITETVDELAALLLPGPMAIKELGPGVPERSKKPQMPAGNRAIYEKLATDIITDYYKLMDADVKKQCPKHGSCNECPQYTTAFDCGYAEPHSKSTIANAIDRYLAVKREEAADD